MPRPRPQPTPPVGYRVDVYCSNPHRRTKRSNGVAYLSWLRALDERMSVVNKYVKLGWEVVDNAEEANHTMLRAHSVENDGTYDYILVRIVSSLCHKPNAIIDPRA